MSARSVVSFVVLAAIAVGGCGGRTVNLGEGSPDQPSGKPSIELPGGLEPTVGELVAQLPDDTWFEELDVAGDFLYLGGYRGASRCQKSNCVPSLEPLSAVRDGVASLRAYESFLGIGYSLDSSPPVNAWLATYSQPDGAGEHVVFDGLPNGDGAFAPLWYGGFVYWPLNIDRRVYRCALPACEKGPEAIGSFTEPGASSSPQADGELVFYNDRGFIYRYEVGGSRAVALLADESLTEALPPSPVEGGAGNSDFIESIATASGKLYASVGYATSTSPCDETCPRDIVRWPVRGGPRQTLVSKQQLRGRVFAFGHELVWMVPNPSPDFDSSSVLYSCFADDCTKTTRALGLVVVPQTTVVADETHLYWLEAGPDHVSLPGGGAAVQFVNQQVRRAARL